MQNKPTQNPLRTMVESHDVDINELRAYVYEAVEVYNSRFVQTDDILATLKGRIDSLDEGTLMAVGELVKRLNEAKGRIKELEARNAERDTIFLALAELGESIKEIKQHISYPPTPFRYVPEKINSDQHTQGNEADGRPTPPVNTPVGNTRVDLEELHILMKEGWTQKQLEQHFGKSEYVIHEAKRRVKKQWFDV